MFVTSDIFDLKRIGRYRDFDWQENLLCGVVAHASQWRSCEADAQFLLESATRCGLVKEMKYAGYTCVGEDRTRPIKPKSFERLACGELAGAKNKGVGALFRGERTAVGSQNGDIVFGGEAGSMRIRRGPHGPIPVAGPPWQFHADFLFPLNEHPVKTARDLFQIAVDILDVEYGYYFVSDDLCFPSVYPYGIGPSLDFSELARDTSVEIDRWANFVSEGRLWSAKWPLFRDLYEMNLISERHTSTAIDGLGYLTDWISAQAGRGQLDDLGKGRLLWILTDAEIVEVRPILNRAGLLLSCRDRVYRDLPGGAANSATP